MTDIGIIDSGRLANIPKRNRAEHEFCFHIHDLMARLLVEAEAAKAGHVSFKLENADEAKALNESIHVLDFLAKTGRGKIERRAVINHIGIALYADLLHFVFEGLKALEKRKFTVALALFRKPFKEALFLIALMCADEENFFDKLKSGPRIHFDHATLAPDEKKSVLAASIKRCRGARILNAERIYSLVYDRKNVAGLAPLFDKATHLVTRNAHIATEDYNLNFIFKNLMDNDLYTSCYSEFSILLLFLHLMQIELYSRMRFSNDKYLQWMLFTSIGAYEALYVSKGQKITRFVNAHFKEFMICPACGDRIKLESRDAPRFLLAEFLTCGKCGYSHHFPVAWLLSKLDLKID